MNWNAVPPGINPCNANKPTETTRDQPRTDGDGNRLNCLSIVAELIGSVQKLLDGGGRRYRSGALACIV